MLTPLEFKEVAHEAMKDALFEAGGAASAASAGTTQKAKKRPRNNDKKKGRKDGKDKVEKDIGPKVEGLSYKVRSLFFFFLALLARGGRGC